MSFGPRQIPGILAALFLTLLVCFTGCAMNITRDVLLSRLQAGDPLLIVDVRSQREYDRDHIPGAIPIPFYSISSGLDARGYSKSDPVVLYCEHGPRSGLAGFSLYLSGHEKVYSLEGAMRAWRKNDFPIEVITH